jgi:hypothetical protein
MQSRNAKNLGAAPPAILVSGDIAFGGDADEYAYALAWLDDLCKLQFRLIETRIGLPPESRIVRAACSGTSSNKPSFWQWQVRDPDNFDSCPFPENTNITIIRIRCRNSMDFATGINFDISKPGWDGRREVSRAPALPS